MRAFLTIISALSLLLFFQSCGPKDCLCTADYTPVCDEETTVYANACLAECNDKFDYVDGDCPRTDAGIIRDLSAIGCGFILDVQGIYFAPVASLPASYQSDTIPVTVRYRQLNSTYTCDTTRMYTQVQVLSLVPR